jgi:transcriptional regulator with XRE-family HTH domain
MKDINVIFGKNLTKYRQKLGLTQQALADKIGMSKSSIQHFESFEHFPRSHCLAWIAEALGVEPYELLVE